MPLSHEKTTQIASILLCLSSVTGCDYLEKNQRETPNNKRDGTVLETSIEDDIVIPVVINNKTLNFLVDTGASVTFIDEKIANTITRPLLSSEIPQNYRQEFSNVSTVSGRLEGHQFSLLKPTAFVIGTKEINDSDIWVSLDLSLLTQSMGTKIDGIIGIDTFRRFNWKVDNDKKKVIISDTLPSASDYQACTGYDDSYNRMPQLWFKYKNNDVAFRMDTGADHSFVSNELLNYVKENKLSLELLSSNEPMAEAGGLTKSNQYILQDFVFNGLPLNKMEFSDNQEGNFHVGMDFLSRFKRYTFIPSRMMFCYDADSIEKNSIPYERSIAIRYMDGSIEVFYNNNEEIQKYGLKNGDKILTINNTTYSSEKIKTVRKLLLQEPKGTLALTIQRENQVMDIVL